MQATGTLRGMLLAATLTLAPSAGDPGPGVAVENQLQLFQIDRQLVAINAATGSTLQQKLELGEQVARMRTQGLVGVAATNVRLLGLTTDSSNFKELRYRVEERRSQPLEIHVHDRVALVPLGQRLAALGSSSRNWAELELGPNESIQNTLADQNLVAVVTDRRAIAFSGQGAVFVTETLSPEEEIESAALQDNSIVLVTPRRVLSFQTGASRWSQLTRKDRR